MTTSRNFYLNEVGYVSLSVPGELSPAYVVAAVAKGALQNGLELKLPDRYSLDVLTDVCWLLGTYGVQRRVDYKQARELTAIGEELIRAHEAKSFLNWGEEMAIRDFLRIVRAGG
jgi:hypothetical protein